MGVQKRKVYNLAQEMSNIGTERTKVKEITEVKTQYGKATHRP